MIKRIVGCCLLVLSIDSYAQNDHSTPQAELLGRYHGAWVVRHVQQQQVDYRLPLGGIEPVDGIERPESTAQLTGVLTRTTYRIPDGVRTQMIADFYQKTITDLGGDVRFQCRGRACGSSNYWANHVFDFSRLYGLTQAQRYLAAELPGLSLAIYISERGNHRIYVQVDAIETDPVARLITQLDKQGVVVLATNSLPTEQRLQQIWQQLGNRQVAIVVHHQGRNFNAALVAAKKTQQVLETRLPRLTPVYSVGRFAPKTLGDAEKVITLVSAP